MAVTTLVRAAQALVEGVLQPAHVTVANGTITSVRTGRDLPLEDPRDVDLVDVPAGTLLLPGNVDSHVHVNEPGRTSWEGFLSATEAAARGGITSLVDMPLNSVPPTIDRASLELKRAVAAHQLHVDVGFWGGAVPSNAGTLEELWDAGVFGFKCFLLDSGVPEFAPLDRHQLSRAMAEVAGFGGLMIVHAEDPDVIGAVPPWSSRRYRDFVSSRPDEAEVSAIRTVIDQTREHGTRSHVLHLSSAQALGLVADARAEGLPLTVETCPHYLVFDCDSVPDGAAEFKCCPPIRDAGNRKALWEALVEGLIDAVVSDHSPSTPAEKARGGGDLQPAWGGISSLQVSFPSVVDAAAERGIGIERVSEWMSAGPARVAGLTTKGAIAPGRDADLVWYEPGRRVAIDARLLAHRNKLSAYTGRWLSGSITRTMVGGRVVLDGDVVSPPDARLLTRPGTLSGPAAR